MTAEILDNLLYLPSEIAWLEDDLKKLQAECNPLWQETIQLEQARLGRCKKELQDGITLINSVDDPLLQEVLIMRYVKGLSWFKIAYTMPGKCTAGAYRKMYSRWLKKRKEAK